MPIASLACAIWALSLPAAAFDLQGHRGARGLAPENTLAAFRIALDLGVTTLETDLAVTKDGVLVISHDPFLNPDLTRLDGQWIATAGPTIQSLTLADLKRYDIGRTNPGSKYGQQFAGQKLAPDPERFAQLTVEAIRKGKAGARSTIQSFDWRGLIAARRLAPEIATGCLSIESNNSDTVGRASAQPSPWLGGLDLKAHGGSVPKLAKAAGCAVWSPFWRNVTAENVKEAQALGLKVVPWTVNNPADMTQLIDLGVDGLITDYPDRARPVLTARGLRTR